MNFDHLALSAIPAAEEAIRPAIRALIEDHIRAMPLHKRSINGP